LLLKVFIFSFLWVEAAGHFPLGGSNKIFIHICSFQLLAGVMECSLDSLDCNLFICIPKFGTYFSRMPSHYPKVIIVPNTKSGVARVGHGIVGVVGLQDFVRFPWGESLIFDLKFSDWRVWPSSSTDK